MIENIKFLILLELSVLMVINGHTEYHIFIELYLMETDFLSTLFRSVQSWLEDYRFDSLIYFYL